MAIKSDTFTRVELTDADAARFMQHVIEDKPSAKAKASYARGRVLLARVLAQSARNR